LGIAALLLGAGSCRAVDTDPQAITATNENAALNKVEQQIVATLPEAFEPAKYDVVLANILAAPLVTLAQSLMDCLAQDGMLVLSGIMSSQQVMVEQAYEGRVRFVDQFERDGWVCLVAKRC
jgi:ribosomal protein L11 methyltransferase